MAKNFDDAHVFTAKWEGGISDIPEDRGGYTAYGVSTKFLESVARSNAAFVRSIGLDTPITRDVVRRVTPEIAAKLFKHEMWDENMLDEVPWLVAAAIYDCAVNHGNFQAGKFAQRAANECGANLDVDGCIGPMTVAALQKVDAMQCCRSIVSQRTSFYHNLVSKNPSQQKFLKGWLNRVNDQAKFLGVA